MAETITYSESQGFPLPVEGDPVVSYVQTSDGKIALKVMFAGNPNNVLISPISGCEADFDFLRPVQQQPFVFPHPSTNLIGSTPPATPQGDDLPDALPDSPVFGLKRKRMERTESGLIDLPPDLTFTAAQSAALSRALGAMKGFDFFQWD